jgi:hypothetical protein
MKVGEVFRNAKLQDGWNVYHEILSINGNIIRFCNYGKTTVSQEYDITTAEFKYMLRKGFIVAM